MNAKRVEPDFRDAAELFEDGIRLQRDLIHLNLRAVKLHGEYLEWLVQMKEAMRV